MALGRRAPGTWTAFRGLDLELPGVAGVELPVPVRRWWSYGMFNCVDVADVTDGTLARGAVGHEVVVNEGVELGVVLEELRVEVFQEWMTCGRAVVTLRLVLVDDGRRCRV